MITTTTTAQPLHLIACVAGKLDRPAAAADLYQSDWFNRARAYVEAIGAPWRILSAKHGLLDPAAIVAPYDETLIGKPKWHRLAWGEQVALELGAIAGERPIVILAGKMYRDAIAETPPARGLDLRAPMEGLGIGHQKQWLAAKRAEAEAAAAAAAQTEGKRDTMTGEEFKRIRLAAGLTQSELGDRLRIEDRRTIRRYEKNERAVSGPVSLLMELLDRGLLP